MTITSAEIAELVEFCRDELETRERSEIEDDYLAPAQRALGIAEKLPALIDGATEGVVKVVVSGLTGSGKSAIAGEIEIALRAIGVPVEWPDGAAEKNMTHADWQSALELYKPRVVIVERNIPRNAK